MQRVNNKIAPWGAYAGIALLAASMGVASAQVQVALANPAHVAKALSEAAGESAVPIEGPVLGYVFNGVRRTIHPIQGITGAAQVGPAVPSDVTLSAFAASPTHDYALGIEAGSGAAFFLELTPAATTATALSAINDGADRIMVSPSGSAAAFYDRQSRSVQILRGLPEDREVRGPILLDSLPGLISALAVNDAGDVLLVGISEESGGSLHLAGPSRNLRSVMNAGRVASIAFLPDSNDAVVADHDRDEVVLIRDVLAAAGTTVLGSARDGIVQPAAVVSSRDGLTVYATSSRRGEIARMATAGGLPSSIDCDCRPGGLSPLLGNAVFALTDASAAPLFVYDGDRTTNGQPDPLVVFVPPTKSVTQVEPSVSEPRRRPRGRSAR